VNPRAGLAAQRALGAVREGRPAWRELEVVVTTGPGHARELAAEATARSLDLVLAVGGDGTANETAWGLLGSETALGLVPVGSGNGLARTLGIPLRPPLALDALAGAVRRKMDVGMVNGRPFLNVAGAGFDAAIGAEFHAHGRRGGRRGVLTYVRLSLLRSLSYRSDTFSLEAGEHRYEGRAFIVAFVNGRQYGGGAILAPTARLDDGLLDVVVFEDAPLHEIALAAPRLFTGGIARFRRYRHMRAASAVLTGSATVVHHRDGEPETDAAHRLEVTLRPLALTVLVPRPVADDPTGPFQLEGAEAKRA
jgi:diacylglycerol kinase (ATP)